MLLPWSSMFVPPSVAHYKFKHCNFIYFAKQFLAPKCSKHAHALSQAVSQSAATFN